MKQMVSLIEVEIGVMKPMDLSQDSLVAKAITVYATRFRQFPKGWHLEGSRPETLTEEVSIGLTEKETSLAEALMKSINDRLNADQ